MSRAVAIAIALAGLLSLAACTGGGGIKIKDPGPVPETTTTTVLDTAKVGLKSVGGRTATTIGIGPGTASMGGTVAGPDGVVDAATVRVERIVGSAVATVDVPTRLDGTWALPMILGGRYRVRAWRAPDLALVKPQIFYLQASDNKALDLRVDRYAGAGVSASIAPNPPPLEGPANLFVLVTQKTVDASGIVRAEPVADSSADLAGMGMQLESANPATTDSRGIAQWRVRCTSSQPVLSVTVADGTAFPLSVPPCVDGSPDETSPETTSTTATTRRTTTTRR